MPLFRRNRRVAMRPFEGAEIVPAAPPTFEHALEEGMLLADYAVRMAVRNAIVTRMLTSDAVFSPGAFAGVARAALVRLAREADAAAERIAAEHHWAVSLEGHPEHSHDYRSADSLNLRRREALALASAKELRRRSADDTYIADMVERSRSDAWREISAEIELYIDRAHVVSDPNGVPERMAALRADLRRLAGQ